MLLYQRVIIAVSFLMMYGGMHCYGELSQPIIAVFQITLEVSIHYHSVQVGDILCIFI